MGFQSALRKIAGKPQTSELTRSEYFNHDKRDVIDYAFQKYQFSPKVFADLGGVWQVEGDYTFYTLETYDVDKGFLVDRTITDVVRAKAKNHPNLQLIEGDFSDRSVIAQLGHLDVAFCFDTLLHQVGPDWDEYLELYADVTESFAIVNPQFTASDKSVRLLDHGKDFYFENTPALGRHSIYETLFDRLNEPVGESSCTWYNFKGIWQWAITHDDLCAKMDSLGFELHFFKNVGPFPTRDLKNYRYCSYFFQKR